MTAPGERAERSATDLPRSRLPYDAAAAVPAPARQALVDVLNLQVRVAVAAQRKLVGRDDVDPAVLELGWRLIYQAGDRIEALEREGSFGCRLLSREPA